ncbi:MAG: PAS domain-containing protein [Methanoregulaceae archaeon]
MDDTLSVVSVNDALLSFFSLQKADLIGNRLDFSPLAGYFDDKIFRKIRSALDGTSGFLEFMITLHEERNYLAVRFLPTVFESGGLSVTLIMEDVTGLTRCRNRYQAILDDPGIMIGRISLDGFLNFTNTAFRTYFSCDSDKGAGIRFDSLFPKIYQKKIRAQYAALNKESRVTTFESGIPSPEGNIHQSRWTITALLDLENVIYEYLALGIDTTDQK